MSYEPTVWKDGDLVTSAKLNKLEQGVANGGGSNVVMGIADENDITLESTWQEIWDNNCTTVCISMAIGKVFCPIKRIEPSNYNIIVSLPDGSNQILYAKNANDYPTSESGGDIDL